MASRATRLNPGPLDRGMVILEIYSGENHIGAASLEHFDSGMGVASGAFHPSSGYQQVQASVKAAAEQRHRGHHANVDGLSARAACGEVIAAGFIQIDDFADVDVDPEVSIQFADPGQAQRIVSAAV